MINVPCVYQDEWLAVFDKPAGMLSVASDRQKRRNLADVLNEHARESGWSYRFYPCHRLDRETSGVIVFAKNRAVEKAVSDLFRHRMVKKTYLALVHGQLAKAAGQISSPVKGETALTRYRLIERRKDFSVVEVSPLTGRTNQIRIHFKSIGHPLVGESVFAFRKDFALKAKRACLHALSIEFKHPHTGSAVRAEAPVPADMRKLIGAQ